jgi:Spy/CpxP family protein refolding chaperone
MQTSERHPDRETTMTQQDLTQAAREALKDIRVMARAGRSVFRYDRRVREELLAAGLVRLVPGRAGKDKLVAK